MIIEKNGQKIEAPVGEYVDHMDSGGVVVPSGYVIWDITCAIMVLPETIADRDGTVFPSIVERGGKSWRRFLEGGLVYETNNGATCTGRLTPLNEVEKAAVEEQERNAPLPLCSDKTWRYTDRYGPVSLHIYKGRLMWGSVYVSLDTPQLRYQCPDNIAEEIRAELRRVWRR